MPDHFPLTNAWMQRELSPHVIQPNLLKRASAIYSDMQQAISDAGARSGEASQAAGLFGGMVKKWKSGLIEMLTQDLLQAHAIDPSRLRVHALQHDIFGRGLASASLKRYARILRNGGGRAAEMPPLPEHAKFAAKDFFVQHQDDLKTAVQSLLSR